MSYYKINYIENGVEKNFSTKTGKEKILFTVRKDNQVNIDNSFSFRLVHPSSYNMNNSLVDLYDLLNHENISMVKIYLISDDNHESLLYCFEEIHNISLEFESYEDASVSLSDVQNIFETRVVIS